MRPSKIKRERRERENREKEREKIERKRESVCVFVRERESERERGERERSKGWMIAIIFQFFWENHFVFVSVSIWILMVWEVISKPLLLYIYLSFSRLIFGDKTTNDVSSWYTSSTND